MKPCTHSVTFRMTENADCSEMAEFHDQETGELLARMNYFGIFQDVAPIAEPLLVSREVSTPFGGRDFKVRMKRPFKVTTHILAPTDSVGDEGPNDLPGPSSSPDEE